MQIEKQPLDPENSGAKSEKRHLDEVENCPDKSNIESLFDGISTEAEPMEETTVKDTAVLETPKEDTSLFEGKNSIENGEQNEKQPSDTENDGEKSEKRHLDEMESVPEMAKREKSEKRHLDEM